MTDPHGWIDMLHPQHP